MAIGPSRPATGGNDPRLDSLLTEMPTEEVFVKNAQNQMEGTGLMINSMKIPNTVLGVDNNGAFKSVAVSPLAQQIVASNSEQMIRGMLGIEIPTNISELNNDSGFITASQVPSTTQTSSDWNSTSGVSQILNKPTLFDGKYTSLSNVPTSFTPAAHTHAIADVTGLQSALDSKLATTATIPYSQISGTPTIPAAQVNSDWNATSGLAMILNKPTIPVVNYPVVSVNGKTGSVVLSNTDVGASATSHTHAISDVTGLQAALDNKITTGANIAFSTISGKPTTLSGYGITDSVTQTSLTSTLGSYVTTSSLTTTLGGYATTTALTNGLSAKFNTPAGSTTQYVRGDGSLATLPIVPTVVSAFTNDSGFITATSLPNYRRSDNTAVTAPIKVKYYTATSDASTSVWTVALGTDFTEVLDVQVTAVSIANTVAGVRQASLNAFSSTSTTLSGVTTGNTILTTVLISAGANTLSLIPSTSVRVTVTGK